MTDQEKDQQILTLKANEQVMREALRLARSALDNLMGDSDLDSDDSDEMKAMQAISKSLSTNPGSDYYRDELRDYINEQAKLADQSSHDWEKEGIGQQAAYRSGMWYAYNDIRNKLSSLSTNPGTPLIDKLKEMEQERAAIITGIRKEFTIGELSGDILQDFATLIDHHNAVEKKLSHLSAIVVEAEKELIANNILLKNVNPQELGFWRIALARIKSNEAALTLITAYNTQKEGEGK
jgi:hypothetical protein